MYTVEEIIRKFSEPEFQTFEKLNNGTLPYSLKEINKIEHYIRYEFLSRDGSKMNVKRCFIDELIDLLNKTINKNEISKTDFIKFCPKTNSDGSCGWAVMVRIIEKLGIGKYIGNGEIIKYP